MREDTVKEVFIKYLESLGKIPKRKKKNVPGPDIIIEGNAYEFKGSKFNKNILFKQIISNALQYSGIGIVIPWDAISCLFLHQLEALELLIRKDANLERSIEVYIVAKEEDTYFLHRWSNIRLLLLEIDRVAYNSIPEFVKLTSDEKDEKILSFLKDYDNKVREYIRSIIIKYGKNPSSPWEGFRCTLEKL